MEYNDKNLNMMIIDRTSWTQGCPDDVGNGPSSKYMGLEIELELSGSLLTVKQNLDRLYTMRPCLFPLFPKDDERSPILKRNQLGFRR